jgi:hypothetical protein
MAGCYDVAVSGDYAYCLSGGLYIINIANPAAPVETGFYYIPGAPYDVAVVGNYVYIAVADNNTAFRIIDVSDPDAPVETGSSDAPFDAENLAITGQYAYVANSYGDGRIIDISDPAAPIEVGSFDGGMIDELPISGSLAYLLAGDSLQIMHIAASSVSGDYAYVINDNGLHVIDITDPDAPAKVGFYPASWSAYHLTVSGDYVYVGTSGGLVILMLQ